MVFKSIQESLAKKKVKRLLKGINKRILPKTYGVNTIAILSTKDKAEQVSQLTAFFISCGINPNAIHTLVYSPTISNGEDFYSDTFDENDFNWRGQAVGSGVKEFVNRQYNLLVNYYTNNELWPLTLISAKVKRNLAVSVGSHYSLNDITIYCGLEDIKTFQTELKKYLNALNII